MNAVVLNQASERERLDDLERQVRELTQHLAAQSSSMAALSDVVRNSGQQDKLSLIVFSGSLDRLIAAFVLATGAAAMGTSVSMFFTFWATAALRKEHAASDKTWLERMFGFMLPKGSRRLPLSQMNLAGGGPRVIRHLMRKKGIASVEEMLALSAELGVEINVCSMSMDLLGMKAEELVDYPGRSFCGVAKFLETAAPGKVTMLV